MRSKSGKTTCTILFLLYYFKLLKYILDQHNKLITIDTKLSDEYKKFIFDNPEYFSPKVIPPEGENQANSNIQIYDEDERNCTLPFEAIGGFFEEIQKQQKRGKRIKKAWKHQKTNKNSIDNIMRSTQMPKDFTKVDNLKQDRVKENNYTEE